MAITGGRVWTFGDKVSTDEIYPNIAFRFPGEARSYLFHATRPGFGEQIQQGDVIVAGRSFGIGSARPAALRLKEAGIVAVLAESMSSIFQRNCLNGGLLGLPVPGITALCQEGDRIDIDVDAGTVTNPATGAALPFRALPSRIVEILDAGGILAMLERDGFMPKTRPA